MIPFSFARPEALWLLLLPMLLLAFGVYSVRRRYTLLRRFGQPEAVAKLSSLKGKGRVHSRLCLSGAILFLVVALAGPRWGKGDPGVVSGRDLVIVLDLSKSMIADDMRDPDDKGVKQRWQAARAGLHDLIGSIRERGGHRVGLVVFAHKPWIVCPLTADYDHFLLRLDEYSPAAPPLEVNPDKEKKERFPSGTRIGSALLEAVAAHDPRFPGYQDVLLISDGDDPADDRDSEIDTGIQKAREKKMPVHVVGVGDPNEARTATFRDELIGPTKLEEEPLKEIARQTRGEYYPAQREVPRLGEFFKTRIESRPSRELSDDALPQPRERYLWFLVPAVVLLVAGWWVEP